MIEIIVAILPVILIGMYIYFKDKEREPLYILFVLLIGGTLSATTTLSVNSMIDIFLPLATTPIGEMNTIEILLYSFVVVSVTEELSKIFYLYIFSYNCKENNYSFDMIVYGVFSALGFALIENLLYVLSYGTETGILRGLTAIPLHACTGALMGEYLGKAKKRELRGDNPTKYKLLAIIIPICIHGMYDFCAYTGTFEYLIMVITSIITLTVIIVNKSSKTDVKIVFENQYCSNCGTKVVAPYCKKCGKKQD